MGVMRFQIHPATLLEDWPEIYRAYVSGCDGRVFPTRIEIDGNTMTCRRQSSDSGKLHVAVPLEGFGRPVIATASLREQEAPYILLVELARGKIGQLRNQSATWQEAGMEVPGEFGQLCREALVQFARATSLQDRPEEASLTAMEALGCACRATSILADAYSQQRLNFRRERSPRLPASLGCYLGPMVPSDKDTENFVAAFDAAGIATEWSLIEPEEGQYDWETQDAQIEWCRGQKLLPRGGPLLDLSNGGLPGWLSEWENDFVNLQSFVCDFIETVVTRFLGRIRIWEVVARPNTGGELTLTEEQRLTLSARALETAQRVDEESQLLIRIDQPWGQYQARGQHRLTPLQFVDALIRSGVALSGVNLEFGVGFRPCGTSPRDPLELSQLIDQWSLLGIPLHVTLACPSDTRADPQGDRDLDVEKHGWRTPWTPAAQAEWADTNLPMLLAKESVVSIFWAHFSDAVPHRFPHAGLMSAEGTPKPAVGRLIEQGHGSWQ
jgi:hypothetical protein